MFLEIGKALEIGTQAIPLIKLASDMIDKVMDSSELDKPFPKIEKKEARQLTENEEADIKKKTGWSDEQIKKCTIDEDGVIHYKCDNEQLEGKKHEPSGVEYIRKKIEINGVKVECVVPKFDSKFDVQLPEKLLNESNPKQFKECNKQLKENVKNDSTWYTKFTKEQYEDIMDGKTPEGYTWHHDVEMGKMQLVETKKHDRTQGGAAHTGGKAIWGGGYN